MPALIERECTDPLGQHTHQSVEAPQRIQPGVEQHNRNAIRIALLDVGQLKSVPKQGAMHQALILAAAHGIAPESIPSLSQCASRERVDGQSAHARFS
jgi:hypothetical protein